MKVGPKIRCLRCKTVIQSKYRHDFVSCDCPSWEKGKIAVDGGGDYLKISEGRFAEWEYVDVDRTS